VRPECDDELTRSSGEDAGTGRPRSKEIFAAAGFVVAVAVVGGDVVAAGGGACKLVQTA